MMNRVFVYGTLKSGLSNHYLLKGCKRLGVATTVSTYRMIAKEFR